MRAEIGIHHRGMRADFGGQAIGDLGAEVKHHNTLRERQEEVHVVLDEQHRDAARRDAANDFREPRALRRREACRRIASRRAA